jgi:hypothetical protein
MRSVSFASVLTAMLVTSMLSGLAGCRDKTTPAPAAASDASANRATSHSSAPTLEYTPTAIGAPVEEFGHPWVTSIKIVDLDADGLPDILYCDAQKNSIRWIRQAPRGVFTEQILAADIRGPAHVDTADVNGSGRLDVLVASMGQILPSNDRIGAVIILENLDNRHFTPHVLIDHVARVTDVRAANFSGHKDGKLDLAVGQFGYYQGETRWMKNLGNWQFESQIVNTQSGCIHTPVADFNGDGIPDFAALISQEWEEVHWFRNDGHGNFKDTMAWGSTNEDYGSSGLEVADVNGDGKPDLIYTNGDGFDYGVSGWRPWHAMQWLENVGTNRFVYHRVGDMAGAFSPCAADLNGDGFVDLLAVSCFADWSNPDSVSMMAWLNDGHQHFTPVVLAKTPTHLAAAAIGNLDGNGVPVIVTGGLYAFPPFEHLSNITLWRRK